jgi:hypothetical protein
MWALLGVDSVAGVAVFAVFYGFVSGAFLTLGSLAVTSFSTSPTMNDVGLGHLQIYRLFYQLTISTTRLRIGISCSIIGLALLSGNPIAGALLSPPEYLWWRPLTFGCVRALTNSLVSTRNDLMN